MHGPEPAGSHQLGDAARVPPIGLHRHGPERSLGVAGLDADGRKAPRREPGLKPLRERAGFEAEALHLQTKAIEVSSDRVGVGGDLGFADNLTGGI